MRQEPAKVSDEGGEEEVGQGNKLSPSENVNVIL